VRIARRGWWIVCEAVQEAWEKLVEMNLVGVLFCRISIEELAGMVEIAYGDEGLDSEKKFSKSDV
jgi:hypothetical protein